ncbi:MAG: hypothetical protein ACREMD_11450 [Gemmatimonadota bacterium]
MSSWTWSLAGPPNDPRTAILRDVWIGRRGLEESLLLTVSDSDPESSLAHTALIPVDDHKLRHEFETFLSLSMGKPLADLGEIRVD